ncbi:YdiK family protein [Bacillus sp. FJAT-47783]|uniref:YdiK family protein n=1 Tax=Bacillus sp. FJAT-47783 TaxID=2922712 RepID=UPI001FAC5A62|nr:YdiK family protein [Bacillus sp. FJAT-47783]
MRFNPNSMGLFYFAMGILFTYLAINSVEESIWTLPTIILMLLATFDFSVSIRMFAFSAKIKKGKDK